MMGRKSRKRWNSIDEIFKALSNRPLNYLVMRNYEALNHDSIFIEGHEDIDLLCDDYRLVVRVLDAKPIYRFPHRNSYAVNFNDVDLQVDIRFVGDGYYDRAWQEDMLKNRVEYAKNIYIMDEENLFYSLIFHAIFQKNSLSDDYLNKLCGMAYKLGMQINLEKELVDMLFSYMERKKYHAFITRDPGIILNYAQIPKSLMKTEYPRLIKRFALSLRNK